MAAEVEDATAMAALNDTVTHDDANTHSIDTQHTVPIKLDTADTAADTHDAATTADVTKDTTDVLSDGETKDAPTEELDTKDSSDTLVDVEVSFLCVLTLCGPA